MGHLPTSPRISQRAAVFFLSAWICLVFSRYFTLGRAFDLSFLGVLDPRPLLAGNFLSNGLLFLRALLCSSLLFITLSYWGSLFRSWMGLSVQGRLLRTSLETALGIVLLNSLWLGLGFNGLWFEPFLFALLMVLSLPALWDFISRIVKNFGAIPEIPRPGILKTLLLGLMGLSLALSMAHAVLPETYFDALVYHLSTLQFWLFNHGITDSPGNLYAHYPFGAELYFLNGFLFQGWETAKGLNVLSLLLCACAGAGWVQERGNAGLAVLAGAMILLLPAACACVWTAQNDVVLGFFLLLFYYALSRWEQEGFSWRWAAAAGLMGGGALTIKYTAVLGIAAGLLAFALPRIGVRNPKSLKGGWPLILLLVFSSLPWLLKNLVFTGDGFYPYLSHWPGWLSFPPVKTQALMGDHEAVLAGEFHFYPWITRVLGRDLDKTIAPLLFSSLPFLFWPAKRGAESKSLAIICGLLLAGGFLLSHQLRLMIPAFFMCFVLMAFRLGELKQKFLPGVWAATVAVFGILSLLSLFRLSVTYHHGERIWFGKESAQEYLMETPQTSSYYGLARAVGSLVPKGDRLLVAGDARSLYYPRPFTANSVFDLQVLESAAKEEKNGEGIQGALRKLGLDALAVSGEEGARLAGQFKYYDLQAGDWDKLEDFIQHWTDLVYWEGPRGIYRIRSRPIERKTRITNLLNLLRTPE